MATPDYSIDYNDKRFTQVEAQKDAALSEVDKTYGSMISQSQGFYDKQIDAVKDYGETQAKNQQEQTDFAIEKIEQQKDQTKQDYLKEQSGAYADWQKQSNQYGANAEQQAAQGMQGTGFAESSQVAMYTAYQNRVAVAREAYGRAVLNYDNAIKDARLQNNSKLAEIAFQTLQQSLQLSLEGFQYKNQLLKEQSDKKFALDSEYHQRYQDVLAQINQENSLAEQVRQHNENLAEEKRQFAENKAMEEKKLAEQRRQHNESLAEERRQFNESLALDKAQFEFTKSKATSTGGGGGGGGGGNKSSGGVKSSGGGVKSSGGGNNIKPSEKEPEVDMKSVLNLGYGPISASKLNSLVKSGVVEEYTSGGKLKYRNSAATNKQKQLFKGSAKAATPSRM